MRGRAGLVPEVGDLANLSGQLWNKVILDLRASRIDDATAHLRELLQVAMQTGLRPGVLIGLDCCGHLCAATRRPAEAITVWAAASALQRSLAASVRNQESGRAGGTPATCPGTAGACRERGQPGERGAAMSLATAAEYALLLAAAQPPAGPPAGLRRPPPAAAVGRGPAQAQPTGTRADHPGRPGPYRRADRGPALHHRAHGQLAPGPDQGQDRLPPPRRHHPAGPQRRPCLTPCG